MAIVEWKKYETVAVMVLNNGENRHNPDFIKMFLQTMDDIEQDSNITSMVITSSDAKNWSLGIDLQWITAAYANQQFHEIKAFMNGLNSIFTRVLLYPIPVIAAINGHCFGNGSILACACDFRFMKSDRGFFCFPEVDINIPFLPGMFALIKKAFPYYKLEEATFSGARLGAVELEAHHVIVKACPDNESLNKESLAFAGTFQKKRPIFREMKRRFHKDILQVIENEDPPYIEAMKLMM
jgi:enoyl-CoA hydratase/carnithine racemase